MKWRSRSSAALIGWLCAALALACGGQGASTIAPTGRSRLEFEEHYQRGMELTRQGQEEGAVAEFRRCTTLDPKDARAYVQLGKILAAQARRSDKAPREAVKILSQAVQLDPKDIQARYELAEILKERLINLYDPDRAMELYEGILRDNPALSGVRLRYATWLAVGEVRMKEQGNAARTTLDSAWTMDAARSHLERVLDEVPPDSEEAAAAHLTLANVTMKSGAWPELVKQANLFLQRYPNAPLERRIQALTMKAQGLFRQGLFKESIAVYREIYDQEPSDKPLWGIYQCSLGLRDYPPDLPLKYKFPLRPEASVKELPPPPKFRDIARELGIDKFAGAGPAGWADYDGDGRYDLVACGMDTFCSLFRNEGTRFRDVTLESGFGKVESGFGAAWGDYDGDGRPDLYIARNGWAGPQQDSLLHNRGDGTFEDVTRQAGIDEPGSGFHVTWFDYNRDGWLDIYVSNGVTLDPNINHLYRNNGNGTFTNATREAGLEDEQRAGTIGIAVGDYDQDGWPDLFVHGRMRPNRLYHNLGDGKFEEVARQAGVTGNGRQNGYVALFQDMESDGDLDIVTVSLALWDHVIAGYRADYVPGPDDDLIKLFRNDGGGRFSDVSRQAGFLYPIGIMAANTADLDNDGYSDLYFGTGNPDLRRQEPNVLYQNSGKGTFVDRSRSAGVWSQGKGHGITFVDWNGDGYLEIYAEKGGFYHGDLYRGSFFLNETPQSNHYLMIDLSQDGPNSLAVGAGVTVQAGPLRIYKEVTAGRGFGSSDPPTLHYGLGKNRAIEMLRVRWPDGSSQDYPPPPVDKSIRIRKGDSNWTVSKRTH
ncbi:MAG: FG-GAP-like repeat-containing protein [Acidobacteria bacterium]|nr:FG-GAP-like repeat-containing protein [Acidobacteriota bacterium]